MRESGGAERPGMRLLREALRACPRLCVVPLANASMKWLVRWLRKCLMKCMAFEPILSTQAERTFDPPSEEQQQKGVAVQVRVVGVAEHRGKRPEEHRSR